MFEGAQEIIHGNKDYQWDQEAPGDLGAVGGTLNAMVGVLLGKELPDENEAGESWEDHLVFQDDIGSAEGPALGLLSNETQDSTDAPGGEGEPQDQQSIGTDDEAEYYNNLYKDYIKAREECNEPTKGITKEKFIAKIKANEKLLAKKHNCEIVRFKVSTKSGKAALQAYPVK